MDWSAIYQSEVAPVLANFSAGPPAWAYAAIGGVALIGVALLVWVPMRFKPIGLVLVFVSGFILYMVYSNAQTAGIKEAQYYAGTVLKKYSKKTVLRRTTGMMEPRMSYWVELRVSETRAFSADGVGERLEQPEGPQRFGVPESVFGKLGEGQRIWGVVLTKGGKHFHFALTEGGGIVR